MRIVPLTLRQANDFVEQWHRHSARTSNDGGKYAVGLEHDGQLVGVAIVGRPVARLLQVEGDARDAALQTALDAYTDAKMKQQYQDARMMGIRDAMQCLLSEALRKIQDGSDDGAKHYDQFRPALNLLRSAWPWLATKSE